MYEQLAILAILVFGYSIIASRIEKTLVSGPMLFVLAGLICGPLFLNWFKEDITNTMLRVIVDLTLAFILFIGAANAKLSTLRKHYNKPMRMLIIGLPGVIGLGCILALWLFDSLSIFEAGILATVLAATDAALGKAVIANPKVPERISEGLNAESGLNDGLCVPILLILIALEVGTGADEETSALLLVAKELGFGLAVGLGLTLIGGWAMRVAIRRVGSVMPGCTMRLSCCP